MPGKSILDSNGKISPVGTHTESLVTQTLSFSGRLPAFSFDRRGEVMRKVFQELVDRGMSPTDARRLVLERIDHYLYGGDEAMAKDTRAQDEDGILSQDHPSEVKAIFRILKKKHPDWDAERKIKRAYDIYYKMKGQALEGSDKEAEYKEAAGKRFREKNITPKMKELAQSAKKKRRIKEWSLVRQAEEALPKMGEYAKEAAKHFTERNIPEKVKEIYLAIKREHPDWPAGKKARIAFATYNKMKGKSKSKKEAAAPAPQIDPEALRRAQYIDNYVNKVFFGNPKVVQYLASQLAARIFGQARR